MSKKLIFGKNARFSIFGQSPIPPTQDVKVHFNSSREDLKNAYLRSSLSASVLPKLPLIASGGVGRPLVATPLIRSNSVPIERTPYELQLRAKSRKFADKVSHNSTFSKMTFTVTFGRTGSTIFLLAVVDIRIQCLTSITVGLQIRTLP